MVHFCVLWVRYGRYHTVKQLLDSEKGSFIINETDGEGLTPLHISSQQGSEDVFCAKSLLSMGVSSLLQPFNFLIFK